MMIGERNLRVENRIKSDDELEEEPVTSKQRSGKRKIDKVSSDTEEPEAARRKECNAFVS